MAIGSGGGERIVQASPIPIGGGRVIASPFQFYLDGNDNIRIEGWNSSGGAQLQLFGRFIDPDGHVQDFEKRVALTADRLRNVQDVALARGFVLNLVVKAIGATPKIGQTFARVSVIRGLSGATIELGVMLQGYVTSQQGLGWPGSPIELSTEGLGFDRVIVATDPGAGGIVSETVPTGARWDVIACRTTFTTDGVAGNRTTYTEARLGGVTVYPSVHPQAVPPAAVAQLFWAQGFPLTAVTVADLTTVNLATPTILPSGEVFRINAVGLSGGDRFTSTRLQVRELLEVN